MLPPSADNPAGFYEPAFIATFNERLLRADGCTWCDCLSFDPERFDSAIRVKAFETSAEILRQDFGDASAFMIKDPRLCITLPVWLPALRAAGAAVAVLLVIRHPGEVMRSLSWRDRLPEVAAAPLWLHHMLEAERITRSLPRAVVAYDDLMHDWHGCMARAGRIAGIGWPAGAGRDRPDIDAFLNRSFRHHIAGHGTAVIGPPAVRGLIDLAWSALQELRDDPAASFPLEWLDQVYLTFAARRLAARTAH